MRKWGCLNGHLESRVTETGQDSDGNRVRLRRCLSCGEKWATEERPIDVSAFYPRVGQHFRERAYARRSSQPCHRCGETYRRGFYRQHVRFSKEHEAALKPTDRIRANERRYGREWKRAHSTSSDV